MSTVLGTTTTDRIRRHLVGLKMPRALLALAELEFIERKQCVHFLGLPGTGKSHLAIALGFEAVKAGRSVFFATLAELVDSMRKAEREGKLRERVKFLSRYGDADQ